MSVKIVTLSEKKLYSAVPVFFVLFIWTGRYLSYPKILSLCSSKGCLLTPCFLCHHTFSVLCGFVVVCPYMLYLLYFIWFGVQGGKSTLSFATEGLVFLQLWSEKCGCCAQASLPSWGSPMLVSRDGKQLLPQLPFWMQVGEFVDTWLFSAHFCGPLFYILAI